MHRPHRPVRVALATYAALPGLNDDDQLLRAALDSLGASAQPVVWDDPAADWSAYDVVVVRSCWDYHLHPAAFAAWLDQVTSCGARLVNPRVLLRWNADKRYLRQLAANGVGVVETVWIEPASAHTPPAPALRSILHESGWTDAVVKPAVSASAHDTWRTSTALATAHEARFDRLLRTATAGALVQPFVTEVEEAGEWSLVLLGGGYSHAALKTPAHGDFRVQWEHGGDAIPASPPAALIDDAHAVLAAAARCAGLEPSEVPYARVDGVERDGRLLLMELECLEPHLFLAYAGDAPERLARAILAGSR
jgi:hypothetical protein